MHWETAVILTVIEATMHDTVLSTKDCAGTFAHMVRLNLQNNSLGLGLQLLPLDRVENWKTERASDLSKATWGWDSEVGLCHHRLHFHTMFPLSLRVSLK